MEIKLSHAKTYNTFIFELFRYQVCHIILMVFVISDKLMLLTYEMNESNKNIKEYIHHTKFEPNQFINIRMHTSVEKFLT